MAVTIVLSRSLQKVNQDLFDAMKSVDYVVKTLQGWRNCDVEFDSMYEIATGLAQKCDVTLDVPRLCNKQSKRNNMPATTSPEYFKRAVWYPYLDSILSILAEKFSQHHAIIYKLVALVPSMIDRYSWSDIVDSVHLYQVMLASDDEVRHQYNQWKEFCLNLSVRPSNPLLALDIVPSRLSHIVTLLKIFCTIPVSTCSPERSFSAMKLVKNYLRNTMTDERLTSLALMYIHPEINIDIERVIDCFLDKPINRKMSTARK